MRYEPHDYQQVATQFIHDHPQAAILLGMGMGKTIITLTAIQQLHQEGQAGKVLIIAPLRVARDTWPAELTKWDHLQHLRSSVLVGTAKQRREALERDADIYIINRENIPWLVKTLHPDWPFDMVVIDELSSFKSHSAQRFKALKHVRPHIHRIIGLTGTPAPNSLLDLWAPFRLLDQGQRLGKYVTHYRNKFFTVSKRMGAQPVEWTPLPGAEEAIYEAIGDITVSMRTTDYLALPPLTVTDHVVRVGDKQRRVYRRFVRDMVIDLDGETIDAGNAATLSGKLQQLASGAIYTGATDDPGGRSVVEVHDEKLDALADLVEAANGQTVLVAYWFQHEATRILDRFPEARLLSTAADMREWNAGNVPVGLIHPASAGHGLNLQDGGHLLVWTTLPWSLELYEQTNARLFRQGQTEPVSVIRLVAEDTVDQRVVKALESKDVTQSALIAAVKAELS